MTARFWKIHGRMMARVLATVAVACGVPWAAIALEEATGIGSWWAALASVSTQVLIYRAIAAYHNAEADL